ncbi:hypothetical protein Purlil1_1408 [Purpureocillium lilacinum]|uniref:Uncharacterized protein n=1 Tax=Purpureocillium lilacinum TaxID=33203 RepID=A0ABR0CCD4_PURLI|nr:hypothetical protein Purlil1_1408 [Purpureocillium lilacinum]
MTRIRRAHPTMSTVGSRCKCAVGLRTGLGFGIPARMPHGTKRKGSIAARTRAPAVGRKARPHGTALGSAALNGVDRAGESISDACAAGTNSAKPWTTQPLLRCESAPQLWLALSREPTCASTQERLHHGPRYEARQITYPEPSPFANSLAVRKVGTQGEQAALEQTRQAADVHEVHGDHHVFTLEVQMKFRSKSRTRQGVGSPAETWRR